MGLLLFRRRGPFFQRCNMTRFLIGCVSLIGSTLSEIMGVEALSIFPAAGLLFGIFGLFRLMTKQIQRL